MLPSALLTARILWGALLLSVGLYLVVLQLVPLPPAAPDPVMAPAFAVVGAGLAVMSFLLPRVLHRKALAREQLPVVDEPDPGGFAGFYREATPRQRVFADREAAYRAAVRCFMTPHVLGLALSEAVALLGFVLAFLGFAPLVWGPFFAVGAALIGIRFPTQQRMIAPLEEAHRAKIPRDGAPRA